jgi:hypothetical protein
MVEGDNQDKDPGIRTSELDAHSPTSDAGGASGKTEKIKKQARRPERSKHLATLRFPHVDCQPGMEILGNGWRWRMMMLNRSERLAVMAESGATLPSTSAI